MLVTLLPEPQNQKVSHWLSRSGVERGQHEPAVRRHNTMEQWRVCADLGQTWPQRINGRVGMDIHNCVSTFAKEMCYSTSRVEVYVQVAGGTQEGWGCHLGSLCRKKQ